MANQQANNQRMMRPVSTNNLGLRHLLQQVCNYKDVNYKDVILYNAYKFIKDI